MQSVSAMRKARRRNLRLILVFLFFTSSSFVAGVQIRLNGSGSNRCYGRVEFFHSGTWGRVCDDEWDIKDAKVVCKELNCGSALNVLKRVSFSEGKGPIWLDKVKCSGGEKSLAECDHSGLGKSYCKHDKDAVVVCYRGITKPSIHMVPAGEVTLNQSVSFTCSVSFQLFGGFFILRRTPGDHIETKPAAEKSVTFNIPRANFSNEGSYECQYKRRFTKRVLFSPKSDSVNLTVRLRQPSISLTSPDRELAWSPEGAEVTGGYRFVFLCSVNCNYPEGRFLLISSDANISVIKPAVNHSASFDFPVAEYKHQGNYSCMYEVNLTQRRVSSSETAPIRVLIKMPLYPLPLVSSVAAGSFLLLLVVLVLVCLVCRRRQQAKQPGTLFQTQLSARMESRRKDDREDYVNIGPVGTEKNLKEEPRKVEEENIYEDPDSFNHYYTETGRESKLRETKTVCVRQEEKQEEPEKASDTDDDYDDVIQPSTEPAMSSYGYDDDTYLNV